MSKHYHFIGIGGMGMGTLASLMLHKGHIVSGSDIKDSRILQDLKSEGANIFIGHRAENVEEPDYVVYSSAIKNDNPEMIASRMKGIPILKRAQLLAQLMETQIGITVAGAHGKTTTTSMVSNLLIKAGMQPTTAIGGVISYNATLGAGKYFIAEVDESDGSFLYFSPSYSIITNVDFEHVDHYHNWNNILMTYQKFIRQTAKKGWVIICGDDVRLRKLASSRKQVIRYGFGKDNDVSASNIACHDFAS